METLIKWFDWPRFHAWTALAGLLLVLAWQYHARSVEVLEDAAAQYHTVPTRVVLQGSSDGRHWSTVCSSR